MTRLASLLVVVALLLTACQDDLVAPEATPDDAPTGPDTPDATVSVPDTPPVDDPTTAYFPWAARASCDVLVPDDVPTVQDGVDAASRGDVVCVRSGTYAESVVVTTSNLTLRGFGFRAPALAGSDADPLDATLTLDADDVTVRGLAVRNPGGLLGIKVNRGLSGTRILYSRIHDVGSTGRLGTAGILVEEPQTDISILFNHIHDIHQTGSFAPDDPDATRRFPTAHGVFFDDVSGGGVADVTVAANWIENVTSEYGAFGVLSNTASQGVAITANLIRDVEADGGGSVDFAQGIGLSDAGPTGVSIRYNDIRGVTSNTFPGTAIKVEPETVPSQLAISYNNLVAPVGLENANDDGVTAECNWWGHPTGPSVEGGRPNKGSVALENPGAIDFRLWLVRPLGRGGAIGNACVGGRGR